MTDAPEPNESSLMRARRLASEALEGTPARVKRPAGATPKGASRVPAAPPPGSPARLSRTMAWVLDDLVGVPGTKARFGVDPLLSIIPVAGTAVGAAMGSVILYDAVRLRAPISVLTRMVGNYVIDWALGLPPLIGPFLDAAYRSNHKNFQLLERTIADRDQVRKASTRYWAGVAILTMVVVTIFLAVPVALLLWLDQAITGG
ncbi:DUF4112 domain-containing protein [Tessaracoccus sp.]